jgi:hypothetical protein
MEECFPVLDWPAADDVVSVVVAALAGMPIDRLWLP